MNARILHSKPFQATVAVMLAAMFVLAGTFAWNSFNQSRTNVFKELVAPDVNLHDDFEGGPNKDVYVENSGDNNIFVRVRLTEYMETIKRLSLVEGHVRDEAQAHNWAPHNGVFGGATVLDNCTLPTGTVPSATWGTDTFHTYYTWIMGGKGNDVGQIYYKPATTEQKGEYTTDANGNQTTVKPPQVVSDPLTGTSKDGDAHLEYKAQVEALVATGLTEDDAMTQLGIKQSLTAKVVSMNDWLDKPGTVENEVTQYQTGDFWVIDEADGWCYWANALPSGKATGLLLDKVDRTTSPFDSNAEYCINVWLQAVDEADLMQFGATGNGGITENGKKLMGLATGTIAIDSTGATYEKHADGGYLQLTNADGTPAVTPKKFIVLGVDAEGKPNGINADATKYRFELDSYFTVGDLGWNGTEYANYDAELAKAEPLFNITKDAGAVAASGNYKLTGVQRGTDGNFYLVATASVAVDGGFADSVETIYLGSVLAETVESTTTYKQGALGAAPFGQIYLNGGSLGGKENLRNDPMVTFSTRSFTHLGNGVYTETAKEGRAVTATTYYFAGKILAKTDITTATDGATGGDEAAKEEAAIKAVFPLQLAVGDKYNVGLAATPSADNKTYIASAYTPAVDGAYTMNELVKGADGNYYIQLDKATPRKGYLGVGEDGFLGTYDAGDAKKADVRVWPGAFGIGAGNIFEDVGDFDESFLKGKTSDDLAVGKTIKVDGYDWVVLGIDENGNRLIMTTTTVSYMHARSNVAVGVPVYAKSYWPSRAAYFANTLSNLKPYARAVTLPSEPSYAFKSDWSTIPATDGLTVAGSGNTGTIIFPLSAGEHVKYILNSENQTIKTTYNVVRNAGGSAVISGLRSLNSGVNGEAFCIEPSGGRYNAYGNSNYAPRMAMWVRLSDADRIATAAE